VSLNNQELNKLRVSNSSCPVTTPSSNQPTAPTHESEVAIMYQWMDNTEMRQRIGIANQELAD
jgi:hypothetical protein